MTSRPSVDDLLLVDALVRHGSLAAAGRELRVSQPAASQRLSRLERRVGLSLFDRDTTGARPTMAGRALAREAAHTLQHLDAAFDRVRAAAQSPTLRVGTFASLSPLLFPALERLLPSLVVDQVQDHGDRLLEWVGEGSLDAAFVAIADQVRLPAATSAAAVAADSYVLLLPENAPEPGRGRRRLQGQHLLTHTFDLSADDLHAQLAEMGATAQLAATAETAVRTARVRGVGAVLTRSHAAAYVQAAERIVPLRISPRPTLFMVTRTPGPGELTQIRDRVAAQLGMGPAPRSRPVDPT